MFQTYLVQPIYNVFMFLIAHVPHGDAGLAIIAMTLLMRAILYPVFTASIRTQMGMQAMQGELDVVSERFKNDKEALARERIALLKKYKVNPFAGVVALVLQLVLIIALYYAMFREGFPVVDQALLYPFVTAPTVISTNFFGFLNLLTPHHIVLAALVGASQYLAIRLTLMRTPAPQGASQDKVAAHQMQQQMMRYFMPALMAVFSYFFGGAVGLYFLTSNSVSLVQEILVRRQFKNL
jgi:YidC/Oxa1 family membrane protein insertase